MCMKPKVYFVANSHIDPVWLWDKDEGVGVVLETFRRVVEFLKQHEGAVFAASSAQFYKWIEEIDPELFEEIKRLVNDGRWIVVGGWWVEPDCNIPCGESFIRHALYGKKYFKEKLGVEVDIGYNIDSFGHSWGLPQVLAKSGYRYYVFMRPNPREKDLPSDVFLWEGPDGSRVLAYRLPTSYSLTGKRIVREVRRLVSSGRRTILILYGSGDHGGGPSREDLEAIRSLTGEIEVVHAGFHAFFREFEDMDLPIVRDELQHHARGCYSALSRIKKLNRRAEISLLEAERYSVMCELLEGSSYPLEELRRAWRRVLFNQFHDILAGTSIPEAYGRVESELGEAMSIAQDVKLRSLRLVSRRIETLGRGIPVVVFNPLPWRRVVPVEVELSWGVEKPVVAVDEKGCLVPSQEVQPSSLVGRGRVRLLFLAELPPMGYRVYWLKPGDVDSDSDLHVADNTLENSRLLVGFDSGGKLFKLELKKLAWNALSSTAGRVVYRDESDTWSHGVEKYDEIIGEFEVLEWRIVERGPVRASIEVESRYGSSKLLETYRVYTGMPYVEVVADLDWREKHKLLKLHFPVNVSGPRAFYGIQFGVIERPCNGMEEPSQGWIDVEDGELSRGLALLVDYKYSFSVEGSTIGVTVARSPIYAHHDPYRPSGALRYRYQDQGSQEFAYILYPHVGGWSASRIPVLYEEILFKPHVLLEYPHKGELPATYSLLEVGESSVLLTALKKAESGKGYIARLFEPLGKEQWTTLKIHATGQEIRARLSPFELKSLLVRPEIPLVTEVNLMECSTT